MMWFRSTWDGVTETRTSPRANKVVNTIPMAASSLTRLVALTPPIMATASTPKIDAPTAKGQPSA